MTSPSRYHRQEILPEFGRAAQDRLAGSHTMVIGLGALGCPAADLLARAGVGRLSLVDRDVVELTNLQRQTLFDEADARAARPKAEAAAARLAAVNSSIRVEALIEDFSGSEAERMVSVHPRPDVLVDGTDNFQTRYLINDVAVKLGIPYVYGGAVGTSGMSFAVLPGRTACLRCVFPEPPAAGSEPTCDTAGILAPTAMIVAAAQAVDAIKILIGREDRLAGSLLSFDLWSNRRSRMDLSEARRADCPCCGEGRYEFLDRAESERTLTLCGRNSVQIMPARGAWGGTTLDVVAKRLRGVGEVQLAESHLRAVPEPGVVITLFADGRAIVAGTTDGARAKSLYAKYVGA